MKKTLLYILLFVLLTIVVFFVVVFAFPYIFWVEPDANGNGGYIFDKYPLLIPSIFVICWSLLTLYIFIRNKYSDLSFGNIMKGDRIKVVVTGALTMVLLKTALQPLIWMDSVIPESRYHIIQMWMDNDWLVVSLLAFIHLALEAVIFSAILRELLLWSKRPAVTIILLSLLCSLVNIQDYSPDGILSMPCTLVPLIYGCWLYYRTSSIWPSFFGMVLFDILLILTPLLDSVISVMASAVLAPCAFIYLKKKLLSTVKPVISE